MNKQIYKSTETCYEISAGRRQADWLFTKGGGAKFEATKDKFIRWQEGGGGIRTRDLRIISPAPARLQTSTHFLQNYF